MVQNSLATKKSTRDELNYLVDRAADLIRTAVDYKFILVLLFMKRLNDQRTTEYQENKKLLLKEVSLSEADAEVEIEKFDYSYKIPTQYLWAEVTKDVSSLPEKLATAISEIARLNPQLQGVINRVDFLEFARNKENRELLRQLVELFEKYNLGVKEVSPDVLGDGYEHILMKFAPDKAKEGEIYTPKEVIKLMVMILAPKPGESVYDPSCGSGGMLITSYLYVKEKYGKKETNRLFLFGQERNPELYAVGEMNLLLHEIKNANLANGDTLDYPRFRDDNGNLKQFDVVIANIPWNQDGYGEERLKKSELKERFSFGYGTNSSADWAWVQHMLASSKTTGRISVVVDNGCLFRGGAEKTIRSKIINEDLVECVILLPEKLFYNTGAPGAIIIFNKNKSADRKKRMLFIDGSKEAITNPSIRRLNMLSEMNVNKIVETYQKFAEARGFSCTINNEDVKKNDYTLNVTLYVKPIEEKETIDITKEYSELEEIEKQRIEATSKLKQFVNQVIQALRNSNENQVE
jgi:type I restriction enzyme M protein